MIFVFGKKDLISLISNSNNKNPIVLQIKKKDNFECKGLNLAHLVFESCKIIYFKHKKLFTHTSCLFRDCIPKVKILGYPKSDTWGHVKSVIHACAPHLTIKDLISLLYWAFAHFCLGSNTSPQTFFNRHTLVCTA